MNAVKVIALWGLVSLCAAIAGGVIAATKNRDHSWWAAWCFVIPPMVLILIILPRNTGPRPRRPTLDDEDREREGI